MVKPDIEKEEETNYLYNYRILGRAWKGPRRQTSWRRKKTTGPEDEKYLVNGTPSSQLSLASNETETTSALLDDKGEVSGTRRSSTSSGIGTSQGDSGPEAGGSLNGRKPEFSVLPILAPIKSSTEPDKSHSARGDSERYVDPQKLSGQCVESNSSHHPVVSLPNPKNWHVDEERTSAEYRHGKLAPIRHVNGIPGVDAESQPKKKRKKKRSSLSDKSLQKVTLSQQGVPLETISNGKINPKLKLSPIPDVSGESQA